MNRLSKRVQRLETGVAQTNVTRFWWDQYARVEEAAKRKLTSGEREVYEEAVAMKRAGVAETTEAHRNIWDRWGDLFAASVQELQITSGMHWADVWL